MFNRLRAIGQLDITIGIAYVVLLGVVGTLMIVESARAINRARHGRPTELRRPGSHAWFHGLPLKFRFKRSKIYGSVIPVVVIGFLVEFVSTFIGIGGGFLVVPALIYIMRVPTSVVIGTSLILTLVTMAVAIVMHAATNHQVDAVLALILIVGGVIGAQFGARDRPEDPRRASAPAARPDGGCGRHPLRVQSGAAARRPLRRAAAGDAAMRSR